jgi:hypothetical protein
VKWSMGEMSRDEDLTDPIVRTNRGGAREGDLSFRESQDEYEVSLIKRIDE